VVQQMVMTALGWERSRNTKRARQSDVCAEATQLTPFPEGVQLLLKAQGWADRRTALGAEFLRDQAGGCPSAHRMHTGFALCALTQSLHSVHANLDSSRQAAKLCHRQPQHRPGCGWNGTSEARLLDDDLLPLHFRGTSSAPAITMPAVYQA